MSPLSPLTSSQMIAADAPFLLCKACEIFIAEMTARAFIVADSNKRRTLARADIAKALTKSDQFDFLIDIVPREEPPGGAAQGTNVAGRAQKKGAPPGSVSAVSTPITYVDPCLNGIADRRRRVVKTRKTER